MRTQAQASVSDAGVKRASMNKQPAPAKGRGHGRKRIGMIRHSILGLTIDERGIACAQVLLRGKRRTVERLARFAFPPGTSLDQPEALGQAFKQWLDEHGLGARSAVVGVPAKWMLAQERELPPVDEAAAIAMLQLQAERLAVEDMVFDVAGPLGSDQPARVLLVGIPRRQLQRIEVLCREADLKLIGAGSTAMAVLRQFGGDDQPLVVMGEQGGELVWQRQGVPFLLRHLAGGGGDEAALTAAIAGELRRTLMLRPSDSGPPGSVLLWNRRPLNDDAFAEVSQRAGLRIERLTNLRPMGAQVDARALNGAAGREPPEAFLPAIAVALMAVPDGDHPINFVRPRLAPPKSSRFNRPTLMAIAAAVLVVLGLAWFYYSVVSLEAEADRLDQELAAKADSLKTAEARLQRFGYGRSYYEQRPPVLECLREVALAYGTDGAIWTTSFTLRENGRGTLQGKASNQQAVLALLDRLKANPRFADMQLGDMRQSTGASRDITFTMSFTYVGGPDAQ